MKPDVQARLFEPFFSTRDFGQGAGLGLATVYGIVSQSGGTISVQSQPGTGTTFNIYLPRLHESELQSAQQAWKQTLHGTETILLVEDQPHVLALSREFLSTLGYSVLTASDGEQALQLARQFPGTIDLLLTDVVMPGMNGRELALRLKQERAAIKVLYVSGFSDQVFSQRAPDAGDDLLEKPFELEELAARIRRILTQ
jgi:CheY-like chemotaxis protein